MMTVVPTPTGVTVVPVTVATAGAEDVKVQAPFEVDEGTFRLKTPTLSREMDRSEKAPMVGFVAVIVRVVEVLPSK